MVFHRTERITLLALAGFGAVSAAAGGIGLVGGGLTFPTEWLTGSPFSSYLGPGLILGIVVGGSQAAAFAGVLRHAPWAVQASALTGIVMMGWIGSEVLLVGSRSGLMVALQILYFLNGLLEVAVVGLGRRATQHAA